MKIPLYRNYEYSGDKYSHASFFRREGPGDYRDQASRAEMDELVQQAASGVEESTSASAETTDQTNGMRGIWMTSLFSSGTVPQAFIVPQSGLLRKITETNPLSHPKCRGTMWIKSAYRFGLLRRASHGGEKRFFGTTLAVECLERTVFCMHCSIMNISKGSLKKLIDTCLYDYGETNVNKTISEVNRKAGMA